MINQYKSKNSKTKNVIPLILPKKNSNEAFVRGTIDYKNVALLRKFINVEGKILPRKITGLNAKEQRYVARAIKTARVVGFLPFINQ